MVAFASVPHKASYMECLLEPILPTSINSEESASTQYYWANLIKAKNLQLLEVEKKLFKKGIV